MWGYWLPEQRQAVQPTFLGAARRAALNALPAAVDHRPRNCAHTGTILPLQPFYADAGDCLVTCDEDFCGGSRVLLRGGQSQGSWRWEGRAAGGEIVKLLGKILT